MSSAISSADSIQDVTVGGEIKEELFEEDNTSEISSFARERIEKREPPHARSLRPMIALCKDDKKENQNIPPCPKVESPWHAGWVAEGSNDGRGHKELDVGFNGTYKKDNGKGLKAEGVAGINEKGKMSGHFKLEGEF